MQGIPQQNERKDMTRNEIRQAFKAIGYKVSFVRNPFFNGDLCNIAFQGPDMLKPCIVSASGAYGVEFHQKHTKAFELALSFKGCILSDTEQKIV